jgi:PPP family 3-phenylpropionic acid transporter
MKTKGLKIKLNILYFIVYGSLACYSPFLTPYFQDRGLSYFQIGILFAINSLVGVLAQPFWGVITDKYASKKTTLIITMTVSGIFVFGFIISKSFYTILFAIIVFMFFQSSIISVNDANTYDLIDVHKNIQYGKTRLMGSIGYALTSLILGVIIKITGINVPFFAYFIFTIVGLALLSTINEKSRRTGSSINISDIVRIVKNKRFIIISISGLIANAAFNSNGNYIAVLMKETGGDVANIGMLWFIVAMSELPFFFFESRVIKKYGVLNIYIIGMTFYIIRFFINSLCTNYQAVLAIQLLQGISFPLYLTATLQYVIKIVPPETRTTALTTFAAITGGIGGFIGNIGGGFLLQIINVFQLYRILAVLCVIALLIGLILKRVDKKSSFS